MTRDQLADVEKWLCRNNGYLHNQYEVLSFIREPERGLAPDLSWVPLPTVPVSTINRLRVLADEIHKVHDQLFETISADHVELEEINTRIRIDIGRMIAMAALNTPFGESE